MADNNVNIRITADTGQAVGEIQKVTVSFGNVDKKLKETSSKFTQFGDSLKGLGQNIYSIGQRATAGISLPLLAVGKQLVSSGSELKAFNNTFTQVFGDMEDSARSWSAELSKSVGLSSGIIDQAQLQFAKMGSAFGYTGQDLIDFSQKWTALTLDLSAFNDIPISDAIDRVSSGLRGEADAVEKLGIFMGQANLAEQISIMGLKEKWAEMDNVTKSQVLYELAMRQTAKANGQAERESTSYQNSVANLGQTFKELALTFYTVVEPQVLSLFDKMNDFLLKLKELDPQTIQTITNIAKWAIIIPPITMYLGAFIESLGRMFQVLGWIKGLIVGIPKLFTAIASAFETVQIWALYLGDAIVKVGAWFSSIGSAISAGFTALAGALGISVGWLVVIIAGIAVAVALVVIYWDEIKAFTIQAWQAICDWLAEAWNWIKDTAVSVWSAVAQFFTDCWASVKATYNIYIKPVVDAIGKAFSYLWNDVLSPIFQYVGGFFKALGELILWVAQKLILIAINYIVDRFNYWMGIAKAVINAIGDAFKWLGNQFVSIYNAYIKPVIQWAIDKFNDFKAGVSAVINGVQALWKGFCTILKTYWNAYGKPIMDVIAKVWDGIKAGWSAGINSVKSMFSGLVNGLKSLWNSFKNMFKLPHISISGSWDLTPPSISVPKIGISWYKNGGLFNSPQVVGLGENGSEAVVPLTNPRSMRFIGQAVADAMPDNVGGGSDGGNGDVLITGNNFYVRDDSDIKKIATELNNLKEQKRRGQGRNRK